MPSVSSSHLVRQFITAPRRCSRDSTAVSLRSWSSDASRYSTSTRPVSRLKPSTSVPIARFAPSQRYSLGNTQRTFASTASTRAAIAQRPPSHRTQLVSYPSPSETREEEDDEDEPDVELVPPEEATLEMTDRAAEVCTTMFPSFRLAAILTMLVLARRSTATPFYRKTRSQRRGCVTDCRRERWVSWIPVQDGACQEAPAGRLVRSHFFHLASWLLTWAVRDFHKVILRTRRSIPQIYT